MDLQYHAFRLGMNDKLYQAPVPENATAILDLGTGTGIWAIDCADKHPDAEIIGTSEPNPTTVGATECEIRSRRRRTDVDLPGKSLRSHSHTDIDGELTGLGQLLSAGLQVKPHSLLPSNPPLVSPSSTKPEPDKSITNTDTPNQAPSSSSKK